MGHLFGCEVSFGPRLEVTMIRAFVQPSTPPYQPLSSHTSEETERKFKGKVVREAQLNCFYISPGGKNRGGAEKQTSELRATLESSSPEGARRTLLHVSARSCV